MDAIIRTLDSATQECWNRTIRLLESVLIKHGGLTTLLREYCENEHQLQVQDKQHLQNKLSELPDVINALKVNLSTSDKFWPTYINIYSTCTPF